jgi:TonB family protein
MYPDTFYRGEMLDTRKWWRQLWPMFVIALCVCANGSSIANAQVMAGLLRDVDSARPGAQLWVDIRPVGQSRVERGGWADSSGRFSLRATLARSYQVDVSLPDGTKFRFDSVSTQDSGSTVGVRTFPIPLDRAELAHMYFDFEVERPVQTLKSLRAEFPPEAQARRVAGEVLIQIAVDSLGAPVLPTFTVLRSPDAALTRAVYAAIQSWEFVPALRKGRPVRQLVQIPFTFSY